MEGKAVFGGGQGKGGGGHQAFPLQLPHVKGDALPCTSKAQ